MDIKELLSKIPGWVGFLALVIIGLLMAVHGIFNPLGVTLDRPNQVGFIAFGLCALIIGAFSWIAGASSKIEGRTGTVGVKVSLGDLPGWAFLVDLGVLVLAVVLFLALK
ncbi:MAG: hypothetical protein IPM29_25085 [Planctomycetes bacterium]|nr:hypothetical protein [Planctomycetota bacterium]